MMFLPQAQAREPFPLIGNQRSVKSPRPRGGVFIWLFEFREK